MRVGDTWEEAGFASPPEPNASVLFCFCGREVHRTVPARDFWRDSRDIAVEAERACEEHMRSEHPIRFWLWRRLGWRWILSGMAP